MTAEFRQEKWFLDRGKYALKGTLWIPELEPRKFLWFSLKPKRPPLVVFHHGITTNRNVFAEYAEFLVSEGFLAMTYDARAHGWTGGEIDFPGMVDDLEAVIESLYQTYEPKKIGIIGHSMGGWVSAMVASRCPRVDAVSTIAGAVDPLNDFITMYPSLGPVTNFLKQFTEWSGERGLEIELPPEFFSDDPFGKKVLRAMKSLLFGEQESKEKTMPGLADYNLTNICKAFLAWPDAKIYVPNITVPFLTFQGDDDDVVPSFASKQLYDVVGTEDKTRYDYEDGTHEIHNTHYDQIAPLVLEFFQKHLR